MRVIYFCANSEDVKVYVIWMQKLIQTYKDENKVTLVKVGFNTTVRRGNM